MAATATVGEDESAMDAFMALKTEVETAIAADIAAKSEPKAKPAKKAAKAKVEEPEEKEEVAEEPEETPAPKAAKAKKFKAKTTAYSRANETHKSMMAEALNEHFPEWKKTAEGKAKAKKLSQTLDGTEFLDGDGEILESFIEAMTEGME
jgi:hypothetical protein